METIAQLTARLLGQNRVRKHTIYGHGRTITRLRRHKRYGEPEPLKIDRNLRVKLWVAVQAYTRNEKRKGEHGGPLTHCTLKVFQSLLFYFAGERGCWPAYERIAEIAVVARSTVALAIRALEASGFIRVINRIVRVDHFVTDLFGRRSRIKAIERLTNSYVFEWNRIDHEAPRFNSKSDVRPVPKTLYLYEPDKEHGKCRNIHDSQLSEADTLNLIEKAIRMTAQRGGNITDYL